MARAIESQCYVLGVNRRGQFGSFEFAGNSRLVSPWGEVLTDAGEERGLFFGEIDVEKVRETRAQLPVIEDRRDDIFPGVGTADGG